MDARARDRPLAARLHAGRAQGCDGGAGSRRSRHDSNTADPHWRRWRRNGGADRGRDEMGRLPALPLSCLRFFRGEPTGRLRSGDGRYANSALPHRRRSLCQRLAPLARRLFPGRDGPHVRQRSLPRMARRSASRRRTPGTGQSRTYRPLCPGAHHRYEVRARRAYPRPGGRRMAGCGGFRHPHANPVSGHRPDGADLGGFPPDPRHHDDRRGAAARGNPRSGRRARSAPADPPRHAPAGRPVRRSRPRDPRYRRTERCPVHPPRRCGDQDGWPDLRSRAGA